MTCLPKSLNRFQIAFPPLRCVSKCGRSPLSVRSKSQKSLTPCLAGDRPVEIDIHAGGVSGGIVDFNTPCAPPSRTRWKFRSSPCSIIGFNTRKVKPSTPNTNTRILISPLRFKNREYVEKKVRGVWVHMHFSLSTKSIIVFQLSIVVSAHYCFLSNCVTSNGRSDTQPLVYRLDKAVLQCICCQWLLVLLILTDSILPGEPKRLMAMWLLECH